MLERIDELHQLLLKYQEYRIEVINHKGSSVWDTHRIKGSCFTVTASHNHLEIFTGKSRQLLNYANMRSISIRQYGYLISSSIVYNNFDEILILINLI